MLIPASWRAYLGPPGTFPWAGRDNSSQEDAGVCAPSLGWLVSHRWPWAGSGQDGTGPASASSSAPGVAPAVQDERPIALCRRVAACGGGHRAHGCGGGRVPFSRTSSPQPLPTQPRPWLRPRPYLSPHRPYMPSRPGTLRRRCRSALRPVWPVGGPSVQPGSSGTRWPRKGAGWPGSTGPG